MVSVVGHIGVENMPGKTPSPTASVREFGAGAKIYLQRPADWRPYLLPTLNQYRIGSGGTKAGHSLGLGLQRELTPEWSLDFRYGTHWISSNSPQSRFSTLQAGARYSF
jgi:opacity protein-like surface antigen